MTKRKAARAPIDDLIDAMVWMRGRRRLERVKRLCGGTKTSVLGLSVSRGLRHARLVRWRPATQSQSSSSSSSLRVDAPLQFVAFDEGIE
jgi:hypothetical protein